MHVIGQEVSEQGVHTATMPPHCLTGALAVVDLVVGTDVGKGSGKAYAIFEKKVGEIQKRVGAARNADEVDDLTKGVIGFSDDAARIALSNVGRIDHASRHLIDARVITANAGSKAARQAFKEIGQNILTSPSKTFDHVMTRGGQAVKGFYGQVNGKDVVIFVAKDSRGGVQAGDIVTSITPSAQQLKNFGL